MNNKEKGYCGEQAAAEYLRSLGYEIAETNYTIRGGEIDIIALDGSTLVFAEVKTRRKGETVAAEAVDSTKLLRIVRSAEHYVAEKNQAAEDMKLRFDCIEVYFEHLRDGIKTEINHIKNIDVT